MISNTFTVAISLLIMASKGTTQTTGDITCEQHTQYFSAELYSIADSHNFHPEADSLSNNVHLPTPEIGGTYWWALNGLDGYEAVGVAFTNAYINPNTNEIEYESALSDLVYKCWSYNGNQGKYNKAMFQVRGTDHPMVNHHIAYMIDLNNRYKWRRIGIKPSKSAAAEEKDDQTSFVPNSKKFNQNSGEIFTATPAYDPNVITSCTSRLVVSPDNNNHPLVSVSFAADPRGQNGIIQQLPPPGAAKQPKYAAKWRMVSKLGRPLFDWPLTLSIAGPDYEFETASSDSRLAITLVGHCELTSQCDMFFAFSINNKQYISFAVDFDGYLSTGSKKGVQVYPACGGNVATGDAATFLSSISKSSSAKANWYDLRAVLAGGNYNNWNPISSTHNGENFPITFEFINNDIDGTFTVRFGSKTFPTPLECTYNQAVSTDSELNFFASTDWPSAADEITLIRSFILNGKKFRGNNFDYDWYVDEDFDYDEVYRKEMRLYDNNMKEVRVGMNDNEAMHMSIEIWVVIMVSVLAVGFMIRRCFKDWIYVNVVKQDEIDPLLP